MNRVLLIGSPGAGKSTLSRRLGEKLGIEVIHLDSLYWHAGWVETPREEWSAVVADVVHTRSSWIIDGHYNSTLETRLAVADTVIFLDVPRFVCLWRVLKRWAQYRGRTRPDMPEGCEEKIDWEFVHYVWDFARKVPKIYETLNRYRDDYNFNLVVLKNHLEVEAFVASLNQTGQTVHMQQRNAARNRNA